MTLIKICGLSTPDTLDAALDAGADMVGLVRFPRSPRHVSYETGRRLADRARGRVLVAVLLVDPGDAEVDEAVEALRPDLLQLHGSESPGRVAEVRRRSGLPVMKAVGVAALADLAEVRAHAGADRLLVDAKPPKDIPGGRPGGNGVAFDWRLLTSLDASLPFMLSGGLTPANVAEALRLTGAAGVDLSSGVERRPGVKDPALIEAFVRAVRFGPPRP